MFILTSLLDASEVEKLLKNYSCKNDLSQKTIDENKGHLVLYTRDRLEKMHAKTLKDVFKTTPVIYYHENRYGLTDPLASGAFEPYRSNFIRLYIDGVEITQGWMGSGVVLYGDMNIDFVDHIEFYYAIPSFESTVEPAYLTMFLYSKNPKQDSGGKLSLIQGTKRHNVQSISYAEQKEQYAYMINLSHTDAKREKIDNGTKTPLSRDFKRTQLFSYLKSKDQIFHLQVLNKKTDSLAGLSLDATPLVSNVDYLNVHMDYGINFWQHYKAQFSYEWLQNHYRQENDTPLVFSLSGVLSNRLYGRSESSAFSGEISYHNTFGKHRIVTGIKARKKQIDSVSIENVSNASLLFSEENIVTAFFQDQYALSDVELVTLGLEYSNMQRNANISDDNLLQLRLGYIYTSKKWSYKTYLYRTMFALDPLNRTLNIYNVNTVPPQITVGFTQEIAYADDAYRARLMVLLMKDKDGLLQNVGSGKTKYFFSIFNYDYDFNMDNRLNLQLYYARYEDIFNLNKLEDVSGYLGLSNNYEVVDFYNAVIWHQNNLDSIHYFDVTSSISWEANENLTFTLKGQNLLGKAKATNLFRINTNTRHLLKPLSISPIDKRITFEVEYTF